VATDSVTIAKTIEPMSELRCKEENKNEQVLVNQPIISENQKEEPKITNHVYSAPEQR
jgi:hypothetical protein